jgi:Fur family ferric uptake transcriptional regulator
MSNSFTRTTKQRNAVIEVLRDHKGFISAQDIHNSLKNSASTVGLSTVYRTMTALTTSNEVDVMLRDDGEALYRLCSSVHHHHLVCRECGTTIEIQADYVEAWAKDVSKAHGFSDIDHTVEIVGVCKKCSK